MRLRRPLMAIFVFLALSQAQGPAQNQNAFSISGYVLDTNGNLVMGVEVRASPIDRSGLEQMRYAEAGQFNLPVAGRGTYAIYCSKNGQGYSDVSEALLKLDPEGVPQVVVTDKSPDPVTTVRLGPSSAKLTIRLVDSATGNPLERAQLVIRRDDRPTLEYARNLTSFNKNGEMKLTIPTLPLRLGASAPGYEDWSYSQPNASNQNNVLLLSPNEIREITVALTATKKTR